MRSRHLQEMLKRALIVSNCRIVLGRQDAPLLDGGAFFPVCMFGRSLRAPRIFDPCSLLRYDIPQRHTTIVQ